MTGMRGRLPFALVAAVIVLAALTQLLGRDLTLTVIVVMFGIAIALVAFLLNQTQSQLTGLQTEQHALAGEIHAVRADVTAVVEALSRVRAELQERADASGRQHATIDHRVVTVSAQTTEHIASAAAAVDRVGADLRSLHERLAELGSAVEATQTEVKRIRPIRPAMPTTSAVPGQDVVLRLRPECADPSVNLVLSTFTPSGLFAGVRTAVLAGVHAAVQSGRPLRLVVLNDSGSSHHQARRELAAFVVRETGNVAVADSVSITTNDQADRPGYHPADTWIATYWTTAVTLQRAVDRNMLSPRQVIYLVQDWEPGFMPWGTEYALAADTYHAGFRIVVNSAPLAEYIREQTGLSVPPSQVFAPQVDASRLHAAADSWSPGDPDRPRVLGYLRPSKPRNLATLALDALRAWGDELPGGVRPVVTLAGEEHTPVDLGSGIDVVMAGKTDLDRYFGLLAETDIGLALMYSPHPSHLPLELPMAGIPTVTNALNDVRRPWVSGLRIAPASPRSLAAALREAAQEARGLSQHRARDLPADLGVELGSAIGAALNHSSA